MENMKRIHPAPGQRFQRVRELHSAREAAQLDRFLADTDPLLIASNCEEEVALAQPVTSLRQWNGCRLPATRPLTVVEEAAGESRGELPEEDLQAGPTVKFLVTCRPTPKPPPPERSVALIRAAMDWIEARLADGAMEITYLFPNRGGIAIMHADSHEGLMELLLSYPAYSLYTWEVQVLADWRTGFENVMRFLEISHGGPAEP
jgi:hypothetical protein